MALGELDPERFIEFADDLSSSEGFELKNSSERALGTSLDPFPKNSAESELEEVGCLNKPEPDPLLDCPWTGTGACDSTAVIAFGPKTSCTNE